MIVKPYDYIIGRLKGEFSPGDPTVYRRDLKNQADSLIPNYHYHAKNDDGSSFKSHPDSWSYESRPPDVRQPMDHQNRPLYPHFGIPTPQAHQKPFDRLDRFLERKLKLEELQVLLYKYYPPPVASQILAQTTYLVNEANDDDFLQSALASLRNIERARFGIL
jgi:hypothetical protein